MRYTAERQENNQENGNDTEQKCKKGQRGSRENGRKAKKK